MSINAQNRKESILDRIVHIEKEIILDIPEFPPLCDTTDSKKDLIDIGGLKLFCERQGSKVPIVLLHGGPGATHHYFHPAFSLAKDFSQVIYYDQRGCGRSDYKEDTGYTVHQAVDDLDALRRALRIEKWIILGHSYGGTLAQYYAVKYPENILGVVLVCSDTSGLHLALDDTRINEFLSPEETKKIREIHMDESLSVQQKIFNIQLNGDWKKQHFHKPSRKEMSIASLHAWKHDENLRSDSLWQSLNSLDFREYFTTSSLPVLIIESIWDLTWGTDKPEKLRSCFPMSQFIILQKSGHNPFDDEPDQFFEILKEFTNKLNHLR